VGGVAQHASFGDIKTMLQHMVDANPSMKLLGGGVPTLVLPFTGHEPENAVKVEERGSK
jgi:hypothetical protein